MPILFPIAWFIAGVAGFISALYAYNADTPKVRWLLALLSAPLLIFFIAGVVMIVWFLWMLHANGGQVMPVPN
jgi:hypothetical protein